MPKVAISDDFLEAYADIPKSQQKKVRKFVTKFKRNPTSRSINYEPIHDMRDDRVRTVRIDRAYRAIVLHPTKGDVYTLLWVDNHDEAMDWARHKRFPVNPTTGALQVLDIEQIDTVTREVEAEAAQTPKPLDEYALFELVDDDDLRRIGVPGVLIPAVRALQTAVRLDKLEPHLPAEAYEALFWIANLGYSVDQAINAATTVTPEPETVDTEDVEAALQHPDSRRRFTVVESEEELESMLDAPLEKWRVFLHPSQAEIVTRHFNGPARVLGGAGTGKTVVAMHRARYLARELFTDPADKLLFLTFSATLADNLRQNLQNLCGPEFGRIEVINLHKWAVRYLKSQGMSVSIINNRDRQALWETAVETAGDGVFDLGFYQAEWENVIKARRITTKGDYLRVRRRGQGQRLSRHQRAAVWPVLEAYRRGLEEAGKIEWVDVPMLAREKLAASTDNLPYRSVLVDEVQDLFPEELKLVRDIAPDAPNNVFMVGDAHQRIHSTVPVVMSRCGLEIRGRSHKLKINYRTTEKIRRWSLQVLEGMAIDDMDGETDRSDLYTSLRSGIDPAVKLFDTLDEERDYLIEQIERLVLAENVNPQEICVVLRTSTRLKNYTRALKRANIKHLYLSRSTPDDADEAGVRLATMHRVKGLEFAHVFIVCANAGVLPAKYVVAEDKEALRERCLLHVAATRARDTLTISAYGEPSPFLTSASS